MLHNLNVAKEVAQPAFIQWIKPANGRAVATVGAGLKIDACQTALFQIGPYAEYFWTTDSAKRQNTLRAGLDVDWQFRSIGASAAVWSPLLLLQANVKSDNERHERGGQLDARLTAVMPNQRWPAPNATWRPSAAFDLVYAPYLGVIVDHVGAASDTGRQGTIIRGVTQLDVSVFPAAVSWSRRVELAASYGYERDMTDGTAEHDDDHQFVRAALNVFFVKEADKAAGLSVIHSQGEDPSRDYARTQEWKIAFTLRIR
ncbi:MAG: hypothetical protein ABIW79_10590 [Gemmatimonas sp.]